MFTKFASVNAKRQTNRQMLPHDNHLMAFSRTTWVNRYRMSPFWIFVGVKDDGGGDDNWSYKTHKAPVKPSLPINAYPTFYRPDALPVAQPRALRKVP